MADACLVLFETTFEPRWFERRASAGGRAPASVPKRRVGAAASLPGGTGTRRRSSSVRRTLSDNATPSGNSASADGPSRCGSLHLTGARPRTRRRARGAVRLVRGRDGGSAVRVRARASGPSSTRTCPPSRRWRSSATRAGGDAPGPSPPWSPRTRPPSPTMSSPCPPGRRGLGAAAVALAPDRPQTDGRATAYVRERSSSACSLSSRIRAPWRRSSAERPSEGSVGLART